MNFSNIGKNPPIKHSAFEHYKDYSWFQVAEIGLTLFLGVCWYILIYATLMTLGRIIRCHYKIRWTESDQRQMNDYMAPSFVIRLTIFLLLQILMTILWARLDFTKQCLNMGFYGVCAILAYLALKALYYKARYGRWSSQIRRGSAMHYYPVSTKED